MQRILSFGLLTKELDWIQENYVEVKQKNIFLKLSNIRSLLQSLLENSFSTIKTNLIMTMLSVFRGHWLFLINNTSVFVFGTCLDLLTASSLEF